MKVYLGKYKNWIGPFQIVDKLLPFLDEERRFKISEFIAGKGDDHTWFSKLCLWIDKHRQERKIKVRIDRWDTWSMDETLAHIIVPMLKQLKETKHGAPLVDDEDVPKKLRMTKKELEKFQKDGSADDKFFARWDWVMDEMIYAFESKLRDWDSKYFEGGVWDKEGHLKESERIENGFRLFGKYYSGLWD